jgi:two-component system OmpR family sensor kinase
VQPRTWAAFVDASGHVIGQSVSFQAYHGQHVPAPVLPPGWPGAWTDLGSGADASAARFCTAPARSGSVTYRAVAEPLINRQGSIVVAVPLSDVAATVHRLLVVEVLVALAVLAGLGVLGWWLVRVGLRPLADIGDTAGAIAAGDLSRRVEPAEPSTEVGRLGLSLNAMLGQIEDSFERQRATEDRLRRFVADASHELRTPLTSIRGYSELFRRGAAERPGDLAKAMERIEAEAARMGVLVDDLLLLARLDQGLPLAREDVDVTALARRAVEGARTADAARPLSIEVDRPVVVRGDEGRLR